ncbi:protealysin inhibitor emfourin [Oxalobacteraceae bacterium A2-2]
MHLRLSSSGGFTGPAGAQARSVDLDALPPARAGELRSLLAACDFFALPDQLVKPQPQSWDFQYTLRAEDGGRAHQVRYHLDAAPAPLRELTERLNRLAPD